ncbi:MAG: CCA tRNA nucleotidyltransferase [Cyanobacteria bacterium]|nr:CCA tRNA nucleotidyltransferase [Cyanobacteriota bacterium]
MPPDPDLDSIVTRPPGDQAESLWQLLDPPQWPISYQDLPQGTALVGGAVRDGLLGRLATRPDLDLVVPVEAIGLAQTLARLHGGTVVVLDRERSIARLVLRGWTVDLARQEGATLAADLQRRDYSINAIALTLPAGRAGAVLVDPCHGLQDLAAGRLRALSEANLLDDPLRMLRGMRLAGDLGLPIDSQSGSWIREHRARLTQVAPERVLAELERMAASPSGHQGLAQALDYGLLEPWLAGDAPLLGAALPLAALTPDQALARQALARGLSPEETLTALPVARLALLFDAASLGRLQASRRLQKRVGSLHHWLKRLQGPGIGGSLERLGEDDRFALQIDLESDLPALLLHLEASQAETALGRWRDHDDPLFHPAAPMDGHSLQQQLQLPAGPLLGQLLHYLKRERAMGRLPAQNHDQALIRAKAKSWLQERAREVA